MNPARLVAHRGSPTRFPENTISGIEAAVKSGALFVEFDIQYTLDFVPILYHDPDFQRISGVSGSVSRTKFDEVRNLPASFPERFGDKFESSRIDSLPKLWQRLPSWPDVKVFPEIKPESLNHFGCASVVENLLESIEEHNVGRQIAAIISKDDNAIDGAKKFSDHDVGWVVPDYSAAHSKRAIEIGVDFMFVNQKRLQLWVQETPHAKWKWVVYTVDDAADAKIWLQRGVEMVETDVIADLIEEGNP